jgi:hypothetical protein
MDMFPPWSIRLASPDGSDRASSHERMHNGDCQQCQA